MSKKMNNKKLIIILLALVVILVLTRLIKIPREQSTLKTDLVSMDTTEVSKIIINNGADKDKPIEFTRNGNTWTVSQGDITAKEEKGAAAGILGNLVSVKPQRLVATSKSKWKDYELSDSTATKITFKNRDGKTLAGILIGKFNYNQPSGGNGGYGRQSFSGSSFVRLPDDNNVYAVDGFLSMMLRRNFDSWRDKSFIHLAKENIKKISFSYPADSSFVLSNRDSVWYAENSPADSLLTNGYLSRISTTEGSSIKDHYTPGQQPLYSMTIEGNSMQPLKIECYQGDNPKEYIFHSDQNPDVYFVSGNTGLFDRLFKTRGYFLNRKKNKKK